MLPSPAGKIWLYHEAIDLRKSYCSLCALVEQQLGKSCKSGEALIFVNRSRTLAKGLWWDRTGWCLLLKRLSRSKFTISGKKDLFELENCYLRMFFDGL
jgi:transposase